jgi:1,5-anhydro-D-fructose reductase (1,5-anhydro-D-mannitol-forming)
MVIGWGIIGCGWVARDYAAPAIMASSNGRLVALHDRTVDATASILPFLSDVRRTTRLDDFFATPGLNAVYVATPNDAHRAAVEAAAAACVAVLCEKPMATDASDAKAMIEACEHAGVFYATAFDQRFHPAHRMAAALIREGAIGRPTAIRIVYACWLGQGWAVDNWRVDPERAGGGAFFDLAPHGLDLAATLLGEPLSDAAVLGQSRVHRYDVEDGAMVIARSTSGVLVQLHVAYNCPENLPRRRLEIVGDRGQLTLTDTMGQTPGGHLVLTRDDENPCEIDIPDADASPFLRQMEAFANHLLGRGAFGFHARDDLRGALLLLRLRDALREVF